MTFSNRFVVCDDHYLLGIQLVPGNSSHSTSIEAKWFKFDVQSKILQEVSAHVLLLPCIPSQTKLLCCQKVVSAVSGDSSPYLIVASKPDCGNNVALFILGANEKLYIAAKTYLKDVELEDSSLDIRLLDGPSLLILQKSTGKFHLIHRVYSNNDTGCVTSELGHHSGKINLEGLSSSTTNPFTSHLLLSGSAKYSSGRTCVTLHTVHRKQTPNEGNVQSVVLQTRIRIHGHKVKQDTSPSNLIPSSYSDIITCALPVPYSRCHSFLHNSHFDENDNHSDSAEDLVISTKFGQLINFCNGQLVSCQEIPLSDVTSLCLVDTFDNEYVVATSPRGGIVAAKLEDLKLVNHWPSAKQAIVGNFLKNGTEQLLLLPLGAWNGTNTIISAFCFTDFGFCSIDRSSLLEHNEDEEMDDGTSSNLETIVEHLESRLQSGMSALQDSKRICQEKAELVQTTGNGLMSMTLGEELPTYDRPNKCNMVNLFTEEGHSISHPMSACGGGDQVRDPWKVTEVWQRTVGDQWIVGVDVINRTGRLTKEVALSLIQDSVQTPQLQSRSKIYRYPAEAKAKSLTEPLSKRRKLATNHAGNSGLTPESSADVISLTVATELPRFSTPVISCQLFLQWTYAKTLDGGGDAGCLSREGRAQWICGRVSLSADDVVKRKFELQLDGNVTDVSEVRRIIHCLNTCQLETSLHLKSAYMTKNSLVETLEKLGLRNHKFYQCYMTFTPGPLHLSRVTIVEEGARGIGLTVHSNNENQLMLFTQMLYSALPDDLSIQHGRRNDVSTAMETTLNHMVQEVNQSYCSIGETLKSSHRTSDDLDAEANGRDISDLRQKFEQKKRKFMNEDLDSTGTSMSRLTQACALTDDALSYMMKSSDNL